MFCLQISLASLWASGNNYDGRLGIGTNKSVKQFTKVENFAESDIEIVRQGGDHALAIDKKGNIYLWGSNQQRQLGFGQLANNSLSPQKLIINVQASRADGGDHHTVMLDTKNNVWVWGTNVNGALGIGNQDPQYIQDLPTQVSLKNLIGKVIDVKVQNQTSYLITDKGYLYVFGSCNDFLCPGLVGDTFSPTLVQLDFLIKRIYVGYGSAFVVSQNDEVYSFGNNLFSQLCFPDYESDTKQEGIMYQSKPRLIQGLNQSKKISVGTKHTLIMIDDEVLGCGYNGNELSMGLVKQVQSVTNPTLIFGGAAVDITTTHSGSIILTKKSLRIVGTGTEGELGISSYSAFSEWTEIPGFDGATHLAAHSYFTHIYKATGDDHIEPEVDKSKMNGWAVAGIVVGVLCVVAVVFGIIYYLYKKKIINSGRLYHVVDNVAPYNNIKKIKRSSKYDEPVF